jgi:integrase
MTVSKLPSGRWRAQTYDSILGKKVSSAKVLGLDEDSFASKRLAQDADTEARKLLAGRKPEQTTVSEWRETWTTDPLWTGGKKESTTVHNAERTKGFATATVTLGNRIIDVGSLPLAAVTDEIVVAWLRQGKNRSCLRELRAMFNAAMSPDAGRLIAVNPFQGHSAPRNGRGRADERPPSIEQVTEMVEHAWRVTSPGFAAWLQVAAWTGMRPGELDAMRWDWVDMDANRIHVQEQWNAKVRKFTLPKNNRDRVILLTPEARKALLLLPGEGDGFCFRNSRRSHWTPSARSHHWDRVRTLMGWLEQDSRKALYLCTRHFAGWWLYNVLELPAEDVAIQLGHEDGGELVRLLYGHRDRELTLARIARAVDRQANVTPLRQVKEAG